jgi:hypothetical protein
MNACTILASKKVAGRVELALPPTVTNRQR